MSAHKSMPMTKKEVMQLINLVEANPVVYSKGTNASNNQLKEATWATITNCFNSLIASSPRRPEQLRLKWENLKKTARKKSTRIRMNNLKTGGGKPDYMSLDDTLEKVASILGLACNGDSVQLGGDAVVMGVQETVEDLEIVEETVEDVEIIEEASVDVPLELQPEVIEAVVVPPALSPHTNKTKFFFSSVASKGKLKHQTLADEVQMSIRDKNRAIVNYYSLKSKQEEEIHELRKKILQNKIKEQQRRNRDSI